MVSSFCPHAGAGRKGFPVASASALPPSLFQLLLFSPSCITGCRSDYFVTSSGLWTEGPLLSEQPVQLLHFPLRKHPGNTRAILRSQQAPPSVPYISLGLRYTSGLPAHLQRPLVNVLVFLWQEGHAEAPRSHWGSVMG